MLWRVAIFFSSSDYELVAVETNMIEYRKPLPSKGAACCSTRNRILAVRANTLTGGCGSATLEARNYEHRAGFRPADVCTSGR